MKLTIKSNPEIVIGLDSAQEEKTITLGSVLPAQKIEPEPVSKPKPVPKRKGKRHCKKCGESGHRSDNCPNGAGGTMAENIRNLKDEGLSSEEIADRLGLSLTVVNKYW